jgi:hypothetical protein
MAGRPLFVYTTAPNRQKQPADRRLHPSANGADFRRMLANVCNAIRDAVTNEGDERDIENTARNAIVGEIIGELLSRRATLASTSLSQALNAVPFHLGAFISGAKDLNGLLRESRSWISVLQL